MAPRPKGFTFVPERRTRTELDLSGLTRRIATELADTSRKSIRDIMKQYIRVLGNPASEMQSKMRYVNRATALAAREATLTSFNSVQRRQSHQYRDPSTGRFSGFRLAAALESSANYSYDAAGVSYINISWMDQHAPQWYRLGMGTGTSANFAGKDVRPMKNPINNRRLPSSPSLDDFGPSAPWFLPDNLAYRAYFKNPPYAPGPEVHVKGWGSGGYLSPETYIRKHEGWVAAGVNAINATYPVLLLNAVSDYLDPKDAKTISKYSIKL